jgi:uncharacterized protein
VDEDGNFLTQREIPQLAVFSLTMDESSITVAYQSQSIRISKQLDEGEQIESAVFDNRVLGIKEGEEVNTWFSRILGRRVMLIRKAEAEPRYIKGHPDSIFNFQDGGQYLIVGQSALDKLNTKLTSPIQMDRFRPNMIFSGGQPHDEDKWQKVEVGGAKFARHKICARCQMIAINQETGEPGKEPLTTLSTYRKEANKIWFGLYLLLEHKGKGIVRVGDEVRVKSCL